MRRDDPLLDLMEESDFDPLANLFDVAFVFAVALLVALVSFLRISDVLNRHDYTLITDPGTPEIRWEARMTVFWWRFQAPFRSLPFHSP